LYASSFKSKNRDPDWRALAQHRIVGGLSIAGGLSLLDISTAFLPRLVTCRELWQILTKFQNFSLLEREHLVYLLFASISSSG